MRVPFRRVAAQSFWISAAVICFDTTAAPSAWAQAPCVLSLDVLRGLVGGASNLVEGASTAGASATNVLLDNNAALELLAGIVRNGDAIGDAALTNLAPVEQNLVGTLCNTLQSLGVQSTVAALVTVNLTDVILSRLDASRIRGGGAWSSDARLGAGDKSRPAPPPGTVGPFAVFASGTLLGGNASDLPGAAG